MKSSDIVLGIVSPDGPQFLGGMGRHVGSLVAGFRTQGMTVHVFDRTQRPRAYRLGKNIGFSLGLGSRLQSFIREHGITVLQIHSGPGGVLLPFFPCTVPVIVIANHTYASQSRLPGQAWKKIFVPFERRTYQRAKSIIAISPDTATSLSRDYGISASDITVIGCGFDLAPWVSSDIETRDRYSCVFVGRPDTRKGFDVLSEAWPIVRKKIPSAVLSVVGWHEPAQAGMKFLGRIEDADLQALLGRSRCSICPSRLEGFGLAAAESIACGTPVIALRSPGLSGVIEDGRTGIFADANPSSLAQRIVEMLQDDALWHRLHTGCRDTRSRFDLATEIRAHQALFSAL